MIDPYLVLRQKELDISRLRKEIEALHSVIPLLVEDGDWADALWNHPRRQRLGTACHQTGNSGFPQLGIRFTDASIPSPLITTPGF